MKFQNSKNAARFHLAAIQFISLGILCLTLLLFAACVVSQIAESGFGSLSDLGIAGGGMGAALLFGHAGVRERATNRSDSETRALMAGLAHRAQHLLIGGAQAECAEALKGSLATLDDPAALAAQRKHLQELYEGCAAGDAESQQEVAEIRLLSVQNLLLAGSNYIGFFETENLEPDGIPYIENSTRQIAQVALMGQDGGAPRWQPMIAKQQIPVPFFFQTSNEFEYPIMDVYTGKVADRCKANVDIAFDMDADLDGRLFAFLQPLIGNFTLTGDDETRVYVAHPRINVANLPTTNLLVPGDNTPTSLFRKSCLDVILAYCAAWGDKAFNDGPLRPAAVYIPSAHVMGWLDSVLITDPDNEMNRQIFDFGFVINYGGVRWTFIGDPTLDPAAGLAYVKFNKGVGRMWTKRSADKTLVDDSIAMQRQNLESLSIMKCLAVGIPASRRVNIAAVKYHS